MRPVRAHRDLKTSSHELIAPRWPGQRPAPRVAASTCPSAGPSTPPSAAATAIARSRQPPPARVTVGAHELGGVTASRMRRDAWRLANSHDRSLASGTAGDSGRPSARRWCALL